MSNTFIKMADKTGQQIEHFALKKASSVLFVEVIALF